MIPQCFPSVPDKDDNQSLMVVYKLSSISGKTRWVDYIPVKTAGTATVKNSYSGQMYVSVLSSVTGKQAWLDYVPVYEDSSATKAWLCSADGYIPIYVEETDV